MIDWVTAIIPCHHDEKVYGGTVASITSDGEIEWQVEKKQQIRGSYESSLSIKSLDPQTILIDGNPAKWLQGHNIFGSDDLIGLINALMHKLIPILNLTPTEYELDCWARGIYQLKRVDCTAMWDLPRRVDVRAWLRAAEMQSKAVMVALLPLAAHYISVKTQDAGLLSFTRKAMRSLPKVINYHLKLINVTS